MSTTAGLPAFREEIHARTCVEIRFPRFCQSINNEPSTLPKTVLYPLMRPSRSAGGWKTGVYFGYPRLCCCRRSWANKGASYFLSYALQQLLILAKSCWTIAKRSSRSLLVASGNAMIRRHNFHIPGTHYIRLQTPGPAVGGVAWTWFSYVSYSYLLQRLPVTNCSPSD